MSDSSDPHDETETAGQGKIIAGLSAGAALIVVIVIAVGFGISTGARPTKPESVIQSGPPAAQLEQSPQSSKLGDGTGE